MPHSKVSGLSSVLQLLAETQDVLTRQAASISNATNAIRSIFDAAANATRVFEPTADYKKIIEQFRISSVQQLLAETQSGLSRQAASIDESIKAMNSLSEVVHIAATKAFKPLADYRIFAEQLHRLALVTEHTSALYLLTDLDEEEGFEIDEEIVKPHLRDLKDGSISREFEEMSLQSPCLKKRLHLIKPALEAHRDGTYALSVPSLLPQIEGLVADLLTLLGNGDFLKQQPALRRKAAKLKKMTQQEDSGLLNRLSEAIAQRLTRHRNEILHGDNLEYDNELFSARCVLIAYMLASNLSRLESDAT